MQKISFKDIPPQYKSKLEEIQDKGLSQIYSNILFLYFCFPKSNDENYIEDDVNNDTMNYLFNYIKQFKFLTFDISNCGNSNQVNIVISVEDQCIIIENIYYGSIKNIINKLLNNGISMINVSCNKIIVQATNEEANEEVNSFCDYFGQEINDNHFIQLTIRSISCFLIRRFFYPSEYFKNQSFFNYKSYDKTKKQKIKTNIYNLLFTNDKDHNLLKDEMKRDFKSIKREIRNNINHNKQIKKEYFYENDFIILRTIKADAKINYYLVFHIESHYIFMMNKVFSKKIIEREIEFCNKCSHRCLMQFYGFLMEKENVIGFIHEFLCNGTLNLYIESNKENISDIFSLMTIIRIYQGIECIHRNSFIYRDLKPSNILLDNNYIPFIADFDTIRHVHSDGDDYQEMTYNIGSNFYSSPEQFKGENISYSSDIFSFGMMAYYLMEKENMISQNDMFDPFLNFKVPIIKNTSKNMKKMIELCVRIDQSERPTIKEILLFLLKEFILKYYIEPYIIDKEIQLKKSEINSFIYENIIIRLKSKKQSKALFEEIFSYKQVFFHKHVEKSKIINSVDMGNIFSDDDENDDEYEENLYVDNFDSMLDELEYNELLAKKNDLEALLKLGRMYDEGDGVQKDYFKAKEYYQLAARQNNTSAYFSLAFMYVKGNGVDQNYTIARHYFELAAKDYSIAKVCLGIIYLNGYGVKKDYEIAKKYFELAKNSRSLIFLGYIYEKGLGVEKNFSIAKEYYELAGNYEDPIALNNLGILYLFGKGVEQNYSKARYYFELAVKFGYINALQNLAKMYIQGFDIPKDYLKAKYYFEILAKNNHSSAFVCLGDLYYFGIGFEKDYSKARNYYESGEKLRDNFAFLRLGDMYYNGDSVVKNYSKAKHYYELSSYFNNPIAFFKLGEIYLNGYDNQKDLNKAKYYFELSAQLNYPKALFYLAGLYSTGDSFNININKSIEYFLKCINLDMDSVEYYNQNNVYVITRFYNDYYYNSCNDLGLIYMFFLNDINKAEEYIKIAGLNEYSFGQNNYGLFNQFYLNNISNAEYMYEKSMKQKFALASFNLAYLKEKENKIEESIKFYIKASEDENEPLIFHTERIYDKHLEISILFIICLTNLILTKYYLSKNNFKESKKYFNKAISKLKIENDETTYKFDHHNMKNINYLKKFILNFPFFDLIDNQKNRTDTKSNDNNNDDKYKINNLNYKLKTEINIKMKLGENQVDFENQDDLFDFIIKDNHLLNNFCDQISDIILSMKKILYTPPYSILFGRIKMKKHEQPVNNVISKDINELFYEGLELDEFQFKQKRTTSKISYTQKKKINK